MEQDTARSGRLQIKSRWTGEVLYEGEAKTIRDLIGTALKSRADLYGADLYGADLSGANLYGQHIVSFAGVGSARRMTTYWLEADMVYCGCFRGSMEDFEAKVKRTHGDSKNPRHFAEYQAGIAFLKACVAAIPEEEKEAGRKAYAKMTVKHEDKAEGRTA
jgi:hypothetical protein